MAKSKKREDLIRSHRLLLRLCFGSGLVVVDWKVLAGSGTTFLAPTHKRRRFPTGVPTPLLRAHGSSPRSAEIHQRLCRTKSRPASFLPTCSTFGPLALDRCVDQGQLNSEEPPVPDDCDHTECNGACWKNYPQSRFPNWTLNQVKKSKIHDAITEYDRTKKCVIFKLDVDKEGIFHDGGTMDMNDSNDVTALDKEWDRFKADNQKPKMRVRALFVENMTGPALRMLGGKYNIEPVFFSSSLNWIPSHFQEDLRHGVGDHISIILPFVQSLNAENISPVMHGIPGLGRLFSQMIDIHAPLRLESNNRTLILDLLSVHLVRNIAGNTMISFHANFGLPTTRAFYLYERLQYAGRNVYWQRMLRQTDDPTFLLLIVIWHAMYAWDEAFQRLYEHICVVEMGVIQISSRDTDGLHVIRAHLLQYSSLLVAFKRTVTFILNTPNPALTHAQKSKSDPLLRRECATLLEQIERLDRECSRQDRRLKDIVDLIDSKTTLRMTEATVSDSGAMKQIGYITMQIAYLTMVFLPATFIAGIFGMHVQGIDSGRATLSQYFETTVALTGITVWILVALLNREMSFWQRVGWPVYFIYYAIEKVRKSQRFKDERMLPRFSP